MSDRTYIRSTPAPVDASTGNAAWTPQLGTFDGARRRRRPTSASPDIAADVRAAAGGDPHAWERLVRAMSPTLRAVARQYRLSACDQEEVAQQTWLALVRHIGRIDEPAAVVGWLRTTARREALRILRDSRREVPTEGVGVDHPAPPEPADDHRFAEERRAAVHGALQRVPARQRAVLEALMVEPPLTYDELSATLRIPVGSIGPTRGRAVLRLRRDPRVASLFGEEHRSYPTRPERPVPDSI